MQKYLGGEWPGGQEMTSSTLANWKKQPWRWNVWSWEMKEKLKLRWRSQWAKDARQLQSRSCVSTTRIFIHLRQHVGGTVEGPSLLMKEVLVFNQIGRGCGGYNSIGYFWTQEQLTMMIEPNMLKVFVLSLALSAMDYSVPKNTKCNKNLCFFIMRKT